MRWLLLILFVVVGLYLLNYPINIIKMPQAILKIEPWIIFSGGVLLIIGGISYFKTSRYYAY